MVKKILPIVFMFLFIGCLEYHEEMWLKKDGSGRLNLKIGLAEIISMLDNLGGDDDDILNEHKITLELNDLDGIEVISSDSFYKNGRKWLEIELTFDTVESLSQMQDMEEGPSLVGNISWEKRDRGRYEFYRSVKTDISTDSDDEFQDKSETEELLKQYEWSYTVHFPGKIIETDETGKTTDKNTVTWIFPLTGIGEDGLKMSATVK